MVIKDEKFAHQIAQSLQIDSVFEEDLSDEELGEKIDSIELDDSINAIFAVGYIDHTAGMSFYILSTASLEGKDVKIVKREKFDAMSITRKDSVNDFEFEFLEDLNATDDFDLEYYKESAYVDDHFKHYYVNDNVEMLRYAYMLDDSRHADFPDDVEVLFIKEGLQIERMCARCEDVTEDQIVVGTLLNTPIQEFGLEAGDEVKFFPYNPQDGDEWVLICDLNKE